MKKLFLLIILIAAIGFGYWLGSPLFRDDVADEQLEPSVEAAIESALQKAGQGLVKTGEALQGVDATEAVDAMNSLKDKLAETNMFDQLSTDSVESFMIEMTAKMSDDTVVDESMPSDSPTVVAQGSFVDVAHHGSGKAKLINLGGSLGSVIRLENLDVLNGPDLRVYLSKTPDVKTASDLGDYIELAKLKGNKGTQHYEIPGDVNAEEYKSVIIYCKPFKVVFNSATLNPVAAPVDQSVSVSDLLGSWSVSHDFAMYEEVTIGQEFPGNTGWFATHLHERPFVDGDWSYTDGLLFLDAAPAHELSSSFDAFVKLSDTVLQMRSIGGGVIQWTRIE